MRNISHSELTSKYDSKSAFDAVNIYQESFTEVEKQLIKNHSFNNIYDYSFFEDARESALARWACIRSKTQREEKKIDTAVWNFDVYGGLTTVRPKLINAPTWDAPDRSDQGINKFSKKSRSRLLQKMRKLNRDKMNLPYFVTLTYHENYVNPKGSKKHLNHFLTRIRQHCDDYGDRDGFSYVWKLEPQKRGAVHYHLAMWIPEKCRRYQVKNKKVRDFGPGAKLHTYKGIKALYQLIQRTWADVTTPVDFINVEYSDIKYRRKDGTTAGTTQVMAIPGVDHLLYGTQVRPVGSWAEFMGYISKYIGKETHNEKGDLKSVQSVSRAAGQDPEYIDAEPDQDDRDIWKGLETGRFWGTSNNLDIESILSGCIGNRDAHDVKILCLRLNEINYREKLAHYESYLKQLKKNKPKKYQAERLKGYRYLRKIAGRYEIIKDKIRNFQGVQFDIDSKAAMALLKGDSSLKHIREFFP